MARQGSYCHIVTNLKPGAEEFVVSMDDKIEQRFSLVPSKEGTNIIRVVF